MGGASTDRHRGDTLLRVFCPPSSPYGDHYAGPSSFLLEILDAAPDGSHLDAVLERLADLRSQCMRAQAGAERRAKISRGELRGRVLGQSRTLGWASTSPNGTRRTTAIRS